MAFLTGTGTKMLWLKESSFGTTPTTKTSSSLINLTSEGLSTAVEKGDEGNLLASKTASNRDLLAITVSGSVSSILRPEFVDVLLASGLGEVTTITSEGIPTGYGQKKYTLANPATALPSFSCFLNRGTGYKTYSGLTINTLSIEAAANDYVKASNDLMGYKESESYLASADTNTLNAISYSKPSYRCTKAELKVGGKVYDVETCTLNINNNLVEAPKTYSSGLYSGQPVPAQREVTLSFNIPYSSDTEELKNNFLTTEDNQSMILKFTTSDEKEYIEITLPNIALTSVTNNVSGTGLIDASFEGTALTVGSAEPIIIVVQSKN